MIQKYGKLPTYWPSWELTSLLLHHFTHFADPFLLALGDLDSTILHISNYTVVLSMAVRHRLTQATSNLITVTWCSAGQASLAWSANSRALRQIPKGWICNSDSNTDIRRQGSWLIYWRGLQERLNLRGTTLCLYILVYVHVFQAIPHDSCWAITCFPKTTWAVSFIIQNMSPQDDAAGSCQIFNQLLKC